MPRDPELTAAMQVHLSGLVIEAEAVYRRLLDADPLDAEACHLLGVAAQDRGRLEEAERLIRRSIELAPESAVFHNNLGRMLMRLGRCAEAESELRESLRLRPDSVEALNDLALTLEQMGRLDDSIAAFRDAAAHRPDRPDLWVNLSRALRNTGRPDESLAAAERAVQLAPDSSDAHHARGTALRDMGRAPEAIEAFGAALQCGPGNVEAQVDRAMAMLALGDLPAGFHAFESRRWHPAWRRDLAGPVWDGLDPVGKTVLLYADGGPRDTIQFVRYAPMVAERGARVVLECQPALRDLLRNGAGIDEVVAKGDKLPPYDAYLPLMSLPRIFRTTLDDVPAAVPYLSADSARVEWWHGELDAETRGRWDAERKQEAASHSPRVAASSRHRVSCTTVGVCWRGEPIQGRCDRSIPLIHFAPLAAIPGVRLISLQKDHPTDAGISIERLPELDEGDGAFTDKAAVMKHLDLVITCDSPVAHLAGAMGLPVWVALEYLPCWRWMLDREDSPWYPTMRLFRQMRHGDWTAVFERMADELRKWQQTGMSALPENVPASPRRRVSASPRPLLTCTRASAPPVFGYFDQAYVLNLDSDSDRMKRAAERLGRAGIAYERFTAIVPPSFLRSKDPRFTAAYYACGLSHRALIQFAYDRGEERTLIFEDDVVLRDDAAQWMRQIVPQLEGVPWDLFYLGLRVDWAGERCGPNLRRVERGFHTHAYAVARRATPKLVAIIDGVLTRMTGTFDGFDDPTLLKVCADPILAIQAPNHSHTHGRWIDRVGEHLAAFDADDFMSHCRELRD